MLKSTKFRYKEEEFNNSNIAMLFIDTKCHPEKIPIVFEMRKNEDWSKFFIKVIFFEKSLFEIFPKIPHVDCFLMKSKFGDKVKNIGTFYSFGHEILIASRYKKIWYYDDFSEDATKWMCDWFKKYRRHMPYDF